MIFEHNSIGEMLSACEIWDHRETGGCRSSPRCARKPLSKPHRGDTIKDTSRVIKAWGNCVLWSPTEIGKAIPNLGPKQDQSAIHLYRIAPTPHYRFCRTHSKRPRKGYEEHFAREGSYQMWVERRRLRPPWNTVGKQVQPATPCWEPGEGATVESGTQGLGEIWHQATIWQNGQYIRSNFNFSKKYISFLSPRLA